MKVIYPIFLLFLLVTVVSAQALTDSTDVPSVEVVQKKWYMEVNNPAFEKSPFGAIEEMQQATRERKEVRRQNETRTRRGLPALRTPMRAPQPEPANGESPNIYTYRLKVKNTGEKAIQTLVWEYVFFETGTEKEVGRLQFVSEAKILPGKTKELVMSSLYPPANTINASNAGKKLREQYTEQVIIQSIQYADGALWTATLK